MQDRDDRILKHVALYRISIRAVIEHLFFDGKSCDDVINRLVKDNMLTVEKLPNRISYYRLSLNAARTRGVQENRARPTGVQTRALRRTLAMLWFCCMGTNLRHRIERNMLTKFFGDAHGLGVPHCWEGTPTGKLIHRVYTPGPNTPPDDVVRTLRVDSDRAITHRLVSRFILQRSYCFAVLVEHPGRKAVLLEQLARSSPLAVPVTIEVVPGVHELSDAIRAHKAKRGITDNGLDQEQEVHN
jgi:hypothetical protein